MEFKQLEAFAAVVTLGSFSRAGDRLFLTQPTISAHIHSLESELGVRLIERTTREVAPSEAGRRFYAYAQNLLRLRDDALAAMTAPTPAPAGVLEVAASTIPAQYLLPEWMGQFRRRYPDVVFHLRKSDSAEVSRQVAEGVADVGLTGAAMLPGRCEYTELCQDELVVITPNQPAYRGKTGFSAQDLLEEPFIQRESGSGTRREFEHFLKRMKIDSVRLRVAAEMEDPEAIKRAVAQGLGVSILSRRACADFCEQGLLLAFPIEGGAIDRGVYLVTCRARPLSAAAQAFCTFAVQAAQSKTRLTEDAADEAI